MKENKVIKTRKSIQLPKIENYRTSPIKRLSLSQQKNPELRQQSTTPRDEYPIIKQHQKLISNFLIHYLNRKTYRESHMQRSVHMKRPQVKKHQIKMDPAYNYRLAKRIRQRRKRQQQQRSERVLQQYEFSIYPFDVYQESLKEEKGME